jgi:hypothetical protein
VPNDLILAAMIVFFQKWGKPQALRVDNGEPFGSPEPSTTSALALCLIAYGVKVHCNRPHTPQQNGKVERQQGTSIRWAEVEKCFDMATAQAHLDEACSIQRERYPVSRLKGKTRIQVFPQLIDIKRPWLEHDFDTQRVYDFLAKKQYVRKVSSIGQICHFSQKYFVGDDYKGQYVCIKLDPFTVQWQISTNNGTFIRSWKADNLAVQKIKNFTVFSKN